MLIYRRNMKKIKNYSNYWRVNVRKKLFILILNIFIIIASNSLLNTRKKILDEEDDKNKRIKLRIKDKVIFKNLMKEKDMFNNHLYKKIDNYDSNRNTNHINQILNNKDKDKKIQLNNNYNKQKNIFLNNNINKYNHVNRIINLKSLNGHNNSNNNLVNNNNSNININNMNNNSSNLNASKPKDSFFTKYNKIGVNQNHKQIKDPYKKEQKCISAFDSMLTNNKNNSEELNSNNLQNINMSNAFNQKKNVKNNNFNDDTPSVSTLAYSKKYNSNSINNQNLTEDHNNKFRMGLLSAYSSSNNNIIIPIIPLQRPLSNFNLGCGQLWENIDNIKNNNLSKGKLDQNSKKMNIDKKMINHINLIDKNMRHKISTAPTQKRGDYNYFSNNDKDFHFINENYNNIFNNINNFGPKLHHIKIDRSLMNNKLTDSLNKNIMLNYMSLEQKQLPKLKNNHFNGIKKAHIIRNNSTKN